MKKLERLNGELFNSLELLSSKTTMRIFGGAEKPTNLPEGSATVKTVSPNCQRADKITKDAYEWIGNIICTEPKDSTVVSIFSIDETDPAIYSDAVSDLSGY